MVLERQSLEDGSGISWSFANPKDWPAYLFLKKDCWNQVTNRLSGVGRPKAIHSILCTSTTHPVDPVTTISVVQWHPFSLLFVGGCPTKNGLLKKGFPFFPGVIEQLSYSRGSASRLPLVTASTEPRLGVYSTSDVQPQAQAANAVCLAGNFEQRHGQPMLFRDVTRCAFQRPGFLAIAGAFFAQRSFQGWLLGVPAGLGTACSAYCYYIIPIIRHLHICCLVKMAGVR